MKRYKDYMDGVETSDALHERLKNLEEPGKKPQPWVKWGAAAAALVLVAGVGAWGLSQSRGGWNAILDHFEPAAEVAPGIADFAEPDPYYEPWPSGYIPEPSGGGYEVRHGDGPMDVVEYYLLPYLDWADASAQGQVAMDYALAPPSAVSREAALDDVLAFAGGEKAMADHLLWDGLDWGGLFWFLEDGTPQAASLYAGGHNLEFSLEVMKGGKVPSCIVLPEDSYEYSNWCGVEITALKNGGSAFIDGVELNEKREVSFFFDGVGYKLTLYSDDAARADELCARFVRYAIDNGFHLDALSIDEFVPSYDPTYEDGIPDKGFPPEDMPTANILHPGDPGYVEPFPAPDGDVRTTPYDPSARGLGSIERFSFSLEWGNHGESYDSSSGVLKKETSPVEHNPGDYIAVYLLTEEQKQQIYDLLAELDVTSYPNIYDPQMGRQTSFPSMSLVLSVRTDTVQKAITARHIAWLYSSEDAKGQTFLSACKAIIDILEQTEEWQALPEYDFWLD